MSGESSRSVAGVPAVLFQQLDVVPGVEDQRAMLVTSLPLRDDGVVTDAEKIASVWIYPYLAVGPVK